MKLRPHQAMVLTKYRPPPPFFPFPSPLGVDEPMECCHHQKQIRLLRIPAAASSSGPQMAQDVCILLFSFLFAFARQARVAALMKAPLPRKNIHGTLTVPWEDDRALSRQR